MPNAYEIFAKLPGFIQDLACTVHRDQCFVVSYTTLFSVGSDGRFTVPTAAQSSPIGHYCLECNKPTEWTISQAYYFCEGCDKPYVPEFRRDSYPVRYKLCSRCDVPATPRTNGKRRSGFSFG